jgi:O-antigen/teichoic acid export membrane protein
LTAEYIAGSLVGSEFRPGVAALLPIMSFTALARGVRSHFIDHAFHLSGQPLRMLWTYGPAMVVNIALNIYVVPRYGMFGAAWTAFVCQAGTVIGGWFLGRTLFPIWLPIGQVVRCALAIVPMIAALSLIHFSISWTGLAAAISLGGTVYAIGAIALDVGDVKSIICDALRRRVNPKLDFGDFPDRLVAST